jgi:amino acid adenylation domain-containing protein
VSELTQRLANLTPEQRAELQRKLLERRQRGNSHQIQPRTLAGPCPLSYGQELMWLIDRLTPGVSAYNVPRVTRIQGPLDVDAIRRALGEIVARHEILRTTYTLLGDQPAQVVTPAAQPDFREIDLSGLPEAEREPAAQRLLVEESDRAFDLSRDLPLRTVLLRLGPDQHILGVVSHHIASDGWSKGILYRELKRLYTAFTRGEPSPIAPLAIQYADYAVWQRGWLSGKLFDEQLAYWKGQLAGAPALLDLPLDRPRPPAPSGRGRRLRDLFPTALGARLLEIGRANKATLFMTLLAGFQILLHRYTRQDRLVVGTPVSGRNWPEVEGLMGCFANSLVLHTDLSGNPTFLELLGRVREMALGAYSHQDMPFEKLLVELNPKRDLSYSPLYQVMFAVGTVDLGEELSLPGLICTRVWLQRTTGKFDMSWGMREMEEGLHVGVEYNPDLFEEATVRRMVGHFRTLLQGIAESPNRRIAELPVLTEPERHQILVEWNGPVVSYPRDRCVHELVEAQAAATPDAVALVHAEQQLTYRAVEGRANQLAHYLRALGIISGARVGLAVEPSPELVIGVLGILKAGAAYVPLDPWYPKDRLAYMLGNSGIAVLLTQECLLERLPPGNHRTVCLDSDWPAIARQPEERCASGVTPDNLVYVIYTSGSTGTPKGAGVYHRGFVNLMHWFVTEFSLSPTDRTLLVSSMSFDLTQKNLFGPLMAGGQLHLPAAPRYDASAITRTIAEQRITLLNCAPSAFYPLAVDQADHPKLQSLRCLFLGGEPIAVGQMASWVRSPYFRCEIANTYGPTECSDICSFYRLREYDRYTAGQSVPIGKPINNVQVLILDGHLNPVPVGVPGEVCVLGEGVGAGYLLDPRLTAQKFLPDPFNRESGRRLYRTGDLARYRPDGNVEFLGRLDHQVKVRGYRIEMGEIETALRKHRSLREAVVVARDALGGDKRLVGYLVPAPDQPVPTTAELRAFLKDILPDYMVPASFVWLRAMPLTPSGKVDRQALPMTGESPGQEAAARVAPRTPTEEALARLWEKILGTESIGVTDNFFDLGGHSLLAVRLFAEIHKTFGKQLPLATLFQGGTIEHLALILDEVSPALSSATLQTIQPQGSRRPIFFASGPNTNSLGYVPLSRCLGTDQPIFGLQSSYRKQTHTPYTQSEFAELARQYVAAMKEVQPVGPYQLGGMCEGAQIAFEMARLLEEQGDEVVFLAILNTWTVENTTNWLWHVHNVAQAVRLLARAGWRAQLAFVGGKVKSWLGRLARLNPFRRKTSAPPRAANPFTARYWPGPDFVPPTIKGRITLFRTSRQPYYRIRDPHLGWWERAAGVEVHHVPGHPHDILRAPNVQVLADQLQACLSAVETVAVSR